MKKKKNKTPPQMEDRSSIEKFLKNESDLENRKRLQQWSTGDLGLQQTGSGKSQDGTQQNKEIQRGSEAHGCLIKE